MEVALKTVNTEFHLSPSTFSISSLIMIFKESYEGSRKDLIKWYAKRCLAMSENIFMHF